MDTKVQQMLDSVTGRLWYPQDSTSIQSVGLAVEADKHLQVGLEWEDPSRVMPMVRGLTLSSLSSKVLPEIWKQKAATFPFLCATACLVGEFHKIPMFFFSKEHRWILYMKHSKSEVFFE